MVEGLRLAGAQRARKRLPGGQRFHESATALPTSGQEQTADSSAIDK